MNYKELYKSEREVYIEGVKHGIAIALSEIESYKPTERKG